MLAGFFVCVLDGFSGSTRVTQALAQLGYDVTSSDISEWSEVFATCYLKSKKPDKFYQDIIDNGYMVDIFNADPFSHAEKVGMNFLLNSFFKTNGIKILGE